MNNIISQDFWCATLTKDKPECKWPDTDQLDEDVTHHLMVEKAVLGLNAKETCMVQATSKTVTGGEMSTMICQLIPKHVPNDSLTLSFKQVVLKLASGDGPVYLTGTHSQEVEDMEEGSGDEGDLPIPQLVQGEAEEDSEEDESEEEDEEEVDEDKMMVELAAAQQNKLKDFMSKKKAKKDLAPAGPASKKEAPAKKEAAPAAKKEAAEAKAEAPAAVKPAVKPAEVEMKEEESDDDEEEDSDEDEEDDDDDEVSSDAADLPGEEDDDEEEEEDDSEEDDDAESEEESDEEPVPATKKRKTDAAPVAVKSNGKPVTKPQTATPKSKKGDKPVKGQTPAKAQSPAKAQTPAKAQSPAKAQTPAKPSVEELKKKLLASPSLPKKFDKFSNLMKNAHKVTDEKEIKKTWEFLQKNRK